MPQQIINNIQQKLKEPLPGEAAQYMMAPADRAKMQEFGDASKFRPSAVLILLCYDDNNELFIPLTERFAYDGVHSGQVSLPGGKKDDADTDLLATALRECSEEIGVSENIEVLGQLSQLYIPVSNFLVQPVVAFCKTRSVFMSPNIREVKHIAKIYIKDLMNENIVMNGNITVAEGIKIKAPYFETGGLKVWGATAMMLSELKVLLKTIF